MRLIDADALLDAISVHLERIEQEIDDAPTIDAVPVVRCEDCAYRPCKQMPHSYDLDYCSYGLVGGDADATD